MRPARDAKPAEIADPVDLARYIEQLAAELANLAVDARFEVLAYLLSLASSEAASLSRSAAGEPAGDD